MDVSLVHEREESQGEGMGSGGSAVSEVDGGVTMRREGASEGREGHTA